MAYTGTRELPSRIIKPRRHVPFLHGFAMNIRVIVALTMRDAMIRAGGGLISYLWTMIEPAILVAFMLFMRSVVKNYAPQVGDSSLLFLLTGFVTFRMVRGTTNRASKAVIASGPLFDMGVIKPLDVVIARTISEYTNWLIVLVSFFIGVGWLINEEVIASVPGFVLALVNTLYFCMALSMLNAVLFAIVGIWSSIWKLLTLPLLFLSGVMYVPSSMPPEVQAIIVWNPFLHCIEGIRSASFLDYLTLYDPLYLFTVSTICMLTAMIADQIYRRDIIRSDVKFSDDEDMF